MDIDITIAQETTYALHLYGLTRSDLEHLISTMQFLEERLPSGLDQVSRALMQSMNDMLSRKDIEVTV